MTIRLGVVMDPIAHINISKDSTFALLLEAQARGWELHYMEQGDLYLRDGVARARQRHLAVRDDPAGWFEFGGERDAPLSELQVVLMRKDPPFDMEYIYTTYLLEHAEAAGVMVVNRPRALRDANEKLSASWFPHCTPPTLATRDAARLRAFIAEQGEVILKPLDGMGGQGILRLRDGDPNISVAMELLSANGQRHILAQRYLPEVTQGDKRILLIDGEPVPYALSRLPPEGETRANLAAGGRGVGQPLSTRDRWLCAEVGPALRDRGLRLVGLDVIGDYITEINVTSPTGLRELDRQFSINISAMLLDRLVRDVTGAI